MFLYKTRLEKAQYRYKMGSTNEFSKFIPFFAKIGFFRGYEKWNIIVIITLDFSMLRVRRFLSGFIQLTSLIRTSNSTSDHWDQNIFKFQNWLSKVSHRLSATLCVAFLLLALCCRQQKLLLDSKKNCCRKLLFVAEKFLSVARVARVYKTVAFWTGNRKQRAVQIIFS